MEVKHHEGYATVTLPERININNADPFMQTLLDLDEQEYNTIILDFTNSIMIDSAGLGRILRFQEKIKNRGGELKIINITSDYIRKMFKVIKLDKVITIEDTEGKKSV